MALGKRFGYRIYQKDTHEFKLEIHMQESNDIFFLLRSGMNPALSLPCSKCLLLLLAVSHVIKLYVADVTLLMHPSFYRRGYAYVSVKKSLQAYQF